VHKGVWTRNLWERHHLEKPRLEWRIIIKVDIQMWYGRHELDWSGSGQGQVPDSCEFGNEQLGSIKSGNLLSSWEPVNFSGRTPWSQFVIYYVTLLYITLRYIMLWYVVWCHVVSCHISYRIVSYRIISYIIPYIIYHIIPYHTISYITSYIVSYHIISYHTLHYVTLHYIKLNQITSH